MIKGFFFPVGRGQFVKSFHLGALEIPSPTSWYGKMVGNRGLDERRRAALTARQAANGQVGVRLDLAGLWDGVTAVFPVVRIPYHPFSRLSPGTSGETEQRTAFPPRKPYPPSPQHGSRKRGGLGPPCTPRLTPC